MTEESKPSSPAPVDIDPETFDALNAMTFKACAWFGAWYAVSGAIRITAKASDHLLTLAQATRQYHTAAGLIRMANLATTVRGKLELAGGYCLMQSYAVASGELASRFRETADPSDTAPKAA